MEIKNKTTNKKRYLKFIAGFLGIIAGVFILYGVAMWGWQKYDLWQGQKAVQKFAESLKKLEEEDYQRAMADTYGGKTPQETLQMYIDAIEKRDFELASKYFVIDEQEKELKSSNELTKEKLQKYIDILKIAIKEIDKNGEYNQNKDYFSLYEPILIRAMIYPNSIWKIIEI